MGNKTLVYKQKVDDNLNESKKHLLRLEDAFGALNNHYSLKCNSIQSINLQVTQKRL